MSHDNTHPAPSPEDIHLALLEHGAHLSRLWLGSAAPRPHLEAAALLAERLMVLLAETAEQWWHTRYQAAHSQPEVQGEGRWAIPVAALSSGQRYVTLDLGGLVRDLAAAAGQQFDDVLNALVRISDTRPWEEVSTLASYTAVRVVERWQARVEAWLADEQVVHLPLPPQRMIH